MPVDTESRIFERKAVELGVRYSPQGSDTEYCTTAKNISGGGARVTLLKKIGPGTIIDLEIFRYDIDIRVRCRGKVVWLWNESIDKGSKQSFDAGIQFINCRLLYLRKLIASLEESNLQKNIA